MTRPVHIAIVVGAGAFGGAEKYLQLLAGELIRLGHRVTLVGRFEGDLPDAVQRVSVPLGPKWGLKTWRTSLLNARRERRQLLDVLEQIQPDVIHLQYKREQILLSGPASRLGRVVWTEHGVLPAGLAGLVLAGAYKRAARSVSLVVAVSDAVGSAVLQTAGVPPHKVRVILNAVDTQAIRPGPSERRAARAHFAFSHDRRVICCLSRLEYPKGVDRLIAALSELPQEFVLLIAGAGDASSELKEAAAPFNSRVIFTGHLDDVRQVLHASDVFALPSRAPEGLPLSLLEAMAAGLPTVVTADAGLADKAHELGAIVSDPSPEGLAASLRRALEEHDHAVRSRGAVLRYGLPAWGEATEAAFVRGQQS
ncbi:glycosyltransferase family 4 protein [Nocardioides pinisoli]|uniref:Glycosyltransferase family 4 protein n=1 Tax=Nocardioides pinisoli TaxID=2950279 RepID=A0ABT1KT48_9ACTN|nr:glycosyltransferase family 4 protein [Nocardioides pinisoli]MCP3420918.1 glycosyltransferase family 4 protein [Nocardioides pinisoli]